MKRYISRALAIVGLYALLLGNAFAEAVWIDVRTAMEHALDRIEGDIRIPHSKILEGVESNFPDKSAEIHLYCRSGGRAGRAMRVLQEAGYTNVSNAGSIGDARKQRGLE